MRAATALFLLTLAFVLPTRGDACCMVPREYPGDVDQSMQEVVVAYADGHEDLILRVKPFFKDAEPPASLAWLVTVPAQPTKYEVVDAALFAEARDLAQHLQDLAEEQRPKPLRAPGDDMLRATADGMALGEEKSKLDIGPKVAVGPYEITPVRARGAEATEALNAYLREHGFATEDPAHLAWFAENQFTFLCIRITPPEGSGRLGGHLELDPLKIRFPAARPYYPGMYSANQGNFALRLTLLTREPLARASLSAVRSRLQVYIDDLANLFTTKPLPGALGEALADAPAGDRWYVNRCDSDGFNPTQADGTPAILGWKEDVTWAIGGDADLPPDWYYGDGERPTWHATDTREVTQFLVYLAFFGLPVLLFIVVLVVVIRRLRSVDAGDADA